jgi:hypothetical protein
MAVVHCRTRQIVDHAVYKSSSGFHTIALSKDAVRSDPAVDSTAIIADLER